MNAESYAALSTAAASLLAVFGGLIRWVQSSFAKRDQKIQYLELALAEQTGKTSVLTSSIAASEARMAIAMEGVRHDIAGMTGRLDRLLETIMLDRQKSTNN